MESPREFLGEDALTFQAARAATMKLHERELRQKSPNETMWNKTPKAEKKELLSPKEQFLK